MPRVATPSPARAAHPTSDRLPALDGVRGLAVLMVIVMHSWRSTPRTGLDRAVTFVANGGWMGVDLFFVLSGFLITGILLDSVGRHGAFRSFYARRALRILPLYYLVITVVFVLVEPGQLTDRAGWFYLHLSNWNMAFSQWRGDPYLNVIWSLAVEEQFYLVWPWIVLLVPRKYLLPTTVGLIGLAEVWRAGLVLTGVGQPNIYMLTPSRMDALAVGAAVAILARRQGGLAPLVARARRVGLIAAAVVLGVGLAQGEFNLIGTPTLLAGLPASAAGFGALVLLAAGLPASAPLARFFRWQPLRVLGTYSYAMYLLHLFVVEGLLRHGIHPDHLLRLPGVPSTLPGQILFTTTVLLMTVGLAWLSWRVLEQPFLSLKRYFPTPPAIPPALATQAEGWEASPPRTEPARDPRPLPVPAHRQAEPRPGRGYVDARTGSPWGAP